MSKRFSVGFDYDNYAWYITDKYGLKPTGGTYDTEEAAIIYCRWLNKWVKE